MAKFKLRKEKPAERNNNINDILNMLVRLKVIKMDPWQYLPVPIQVESLESYLKQVTFDDKHLKLWKNIHGKK